MLIKQEHQNYQIESMESNQKYHRKKCPAALDLKSHTIEPEIFILKYYIYKSKELTLNSRE